MEHLDKNLPVHSAHIVIQRTHMIQPHSEVLVNDQPFDFTLPTEDEVRLVKYWDAGKGLKGHRYGQVSAKISFDEHKLFVYIGPEVLKDLFVKIAERWANRPRIVPFTREEVQAITHKSKARQDEEDHLWR